MKIDVLSRGKKKKFIEGLSDLGIKKIPQMLVRGGKENERLIMPEMLIKSYSSPSVVLAILGIFYFL